MRLDTEIAVIGGGIAGCSAALHLARRDLPVVVLEKGFAGAGASGVNFGGVRRNGRHIEELSLATRSFTDYWRKLADWIGTDCEYVETGHVKFARNDDELAVMDAYAEAAADHDLALERLNRNEIMERYGWLGDVAHAAYRCPTDAQANPRLVGPAFARAAQAAGADIREEQTVTAVERVGDHFELGTMEGLSVRTNRLINCSGASGGRIAALFGDHVPISPLAPEMIVTEPVPYFLKPVVGTVGAWIYIRQIPRGNIIFGNSGGGEANLETGHADVKPVDTLSSLAGAVRLVPAIANAHVIRTWTGLDGMTPDGFPVIGRSQTTPDLFHAVGFSGHGFQLGPATGAVLAELAEDGRTSTDISALDLARFDKSEA